MNPKSYILDFVIPQGPTGPTGDTGVSLQSYGGLYNDTPSAITIDSTGRKALTLPNNMPGNNITYFSDNTTLIIVLDGVYEINYGCTYSASTPQGSLKQSILSISANGTDIPESIISNTIINSNDSSTIFGSFHNSFITELKASDELNLVFSSSAQSSISFPTGVNAILTIKKID